MQHNKIVGSSSPQFEKIKFKPNTLKIIDNLLDLRKPPTKQHAIRVARSTLIFAEKIGIKNQDFECLYFGSLLHDIGKIKIPEHILYKQEPFTPKEWRLICQHPLFGYELLRDIPELAHATSIPYSHHEKWDGTGYPRGLKGKAIPVCARLFSVVDVWDALTSNRSYRKAWPKNKALNHIWKLSGSEFDPDIVNKFINLRIYRYNKYEATSDLNIQDTLH